jgi:hypothetical protein
MSIRASSLAEQLAIIETVTAVGVGADHRDWTACRDAFTDRIALDHDGDGNRADDIAANEVIARWQRIWDSFAATLHAVTNHQVELRGVQATCRSHVQALHVAHDGRDLRLLHRPARSTPTAGASPPAATRRSTARAISPSSRAPDPAPSKDTR